MFKIIPMYATLFFLFIVVIVFTPIAGYEIQVFGMDLKISDLFLLFTALLATPLFFLEKSSSKSARNTFLCLTFIVNFSFLSVAWARFDEDNSTIVYQIILAALTITIPYLASKMMKSDYLNPQKYLTRIATLLTIGLIFYMVALGNDYRLAGFIGSAAIISVIIIPIVAIYYYNVTIKFRIFTSTIFLLVSVLSVFSTQSRAGIIMLVIFILLYMIRKPSIKKILSVGILGTIFYFTFQKNITLNRFLIAGIEDNSRSTMFESSVNWWLESPFTFFFGNGYGTLWQWSAHQDIIKTTSMSPWTITENGGLMYHAHSLVNQLIAETGLIGLIPFIIIVLIMIIETIRSIKQKNEFKTILLISLIATLPAFVTDLMVFRNWGVSIIWLFFLFATLQFNEKTKNDKTSQ